MKGRRLIGWVIVVAIVSMAIPAWADTHAPWPSDWNNWSDPNLMVTVGNPGNAAETRYDANGFGAVSYTYKIGKFEVTAGQYTAFLNAVAKTDTYSLYSIWMDSDNDYESCHIKRTGSSGSYAYSVDPNWANRPVNWVSWGDAARFANWLTNGQKTGAQDANTTEDGSYYLNGATSNSALLAVTRRSDAKYVLPTEDEWFKAAYYKGGSTSAGYWKYPTGSDSVPSNDLLNPDGNNNANFYQSGYTIGSPYWRTEVGDFENSESPYGTFDQAGNVWEWTEEIDDSVYRDQPGGSFGSSFGLDSSSRGYGTIPSIEYDDLGFRVVEVPEPGTLSLLALGGLAVLRRGSGRVLRRRK